MAQVSKNKKYGHVYGPLRVTPLGRFSWPSLVEPKAPPPPKEGEAPGPSRYEVSLLLEKKNPQVEAFVATMNTLKPEMLTLFNQKRSAPLGDVQVLQDGDDDQRFDKEKYPYYKGMWVLVARNTEAPQVVGNQKPRPEVIEAKEVSGGMQGMLVVTPMLTSHGMSYKLVVVQKINDDGTRFGGGTRDAIGLLEATTPDEVEAIQEAPPNLVDAAVAGDMQAVQKAAAQAVSQEELAATAAKLKASKGTKAAIDLL